MIGMIGGKQMFLQGKYFLDQFLLPLLLRHIAQVFSPGIQFAFGKIPFVSPEYHQYLMLFIGDQSASSLYNGKFLPESFLQFFQVGMKKYASMYLLQFHFMYQWLLRYAQKIHQ